MPMQIKTHRGNGLKATHKKLSEKNQQRTLALNGKAWRDLRAVVLSEQPLCPECEKDGLIVDAVDVDHIDNNPANNQRSNLVGLCKSHHSIKTNMVVNGKQKRYGFDEGGYPLDPEHHWNIDQKQRLRKSPATGGSEPPAYPHAHGRRMEV